jgi:hypothetical protein
VLRQAMKGLLPESVRTRLTKARYGSHSFWEAIQCLGGERFFNSLTIAANGWVNSQEVKRMYQNTLAQTNRHGADATPYLLPLWMICAVELWFREVFGNGANCSNGRENIN